MFGRRMMFRLLAAGVIFCLAAIGHSVHQYRQLAQKWYVPIDSQAAHADGAAKDGRMQGNPPPARDVLTGKVPLQPFLLLILGVDSRNGESARADAIMLAAINPAKRSASLVSVPRDSYVGIPGKGHDKVNHAMAFGGPGLVKRSLEDFLDIRIDRYVTVDFEGFRRVVDELGGIRVEVKKRMRYSDPSDGTSIDLKPGVQLLSGKEALDYARFRKSDLGGEDSDYQRIARQQEIIRAIAEEAVSAKALARLYPLLEIAGEHVKTDLTEAEMASLLLSFGTPGDNRVATDTLEGRDERIWRNGVMGWYHLVPREERQRVQNVLLQTLKP